MLMAALAPPRILIPQWRQQAPQVIVVEFVHQRQQFPQLAGRETFTREPSEVMSWQIREQTTLVLPEGHFPANQSLKIVSLHMQE